MDEVFSYVIAYVFMYYNMVFATFRVLSYINLDLYKWHELSNMSNFTCDLS